MEDSLSSSLGMIRTNAAFHELYEYYRHRAKNPLTGKQAIIVLVTKLLRIIHTIVIKSMTYDEGGNDVIHSAAGGVCKCRLTESNALNYASDAMATTSEK